MGFYGGLRVVSMFEGMFVVTYFELSLKVVRSSITNPRLGRETNSKFRGILWWFEGCRWFDCIVVVTLSFLQTIK